MKYGIRDYRGGGRSSARETAARVAAGAIARKVRARRHVRGALVQMGPHAIDRAQLGLGRGRTATRSSARTPKAAAFFEDYLDGIRKAGSSIGAVIEIVAEGVPAGPRRADLRQARCRSRRGADVHQCGQGRRDRRRLRGGRRCAARRMPTRCAPATTGAPTFLSNHAGGILGGISTGQPVVCRFAVKPTSSILTPRATRRPRTGGEAEFHQGPARPLRRHPRRAGRRGHGGLRAGRPRLCAIADRWVRAILAVRPVARLQHQLKAASARLIWVQF